MVAHNPDVIAMSEFRTPRGNALCASMMDAGWRFVESTNPSGNENGVCLVSRTPMQRAKQYPGRPDNHVRWLDVDLPELGFGLSALHIMCGNVKGSTPVKPKTHFWNSVIAMA